MVASHTLCLDRLHRMSRRRYSLAERGVKNFSLVVHIARHHSLRLPPETTTGRVIIDITTKAKNPAAGAVTKIKRSGTSSNQLKATPRGIVRMRLVIPVEIHSESKELANSVM